MPNGFYCFICEKGVNPVIRSMLKHIPKRPYCPYCDYHVFFVDFDYLDELGFEHQGVVIWDRSVLMDLAIPFMQYILNYEQLQVLKTIKDFPKTEIGVKRYESKDSDHYLLVDEKTADIFEVISKSKLGKSKLGVTSRPTLHFLRKIRGED